MKTWTSDTMVINLHVLGGKRKGYSESRRWEKDPEKIQLMEKQVKLQLEECDVRASHVDVPRTKINLLTVYFLRRWINKAGDIKLL